MRNGIILTAIAFAVTLAIVVGNRLSAEATAMVVGIVCGISATIPISIGLVIAASRHWGDGRDESVTRLYESVTRLDESATRLYAPQPPVVVISPPQVPPAPYGFASGQLYLPPSAPAPGAPRDFKIIGEE